MTLFVYVGFTLYKQCNTLIISHSGGSRPLGPEINILHLLLHKPPSTLLGQVLQSGLFLYHILFNRTQVLPIQSLRHLSILLLNLVSRHQHLYFYKLGFRLLGQFYSQSFLYGTLFLLITYYLSISYKFRALLTELQSEFLRYFNN